MFLCLPFAATIGAMNVQLGSDTVKHNVYIQCGVSWNTLVALIGHCGLDSTATSVARQSWQHAGVSGFMAERL